METQKLTFHRDQNYDILLGHDILPQIVARFSRMGFSKRIAILTNEIVAKWYLQPLQDLLKTRGYTVSPIVLPDGESQKTLETASSIFHRLMEADLDRLSPMITLGGGVIGDLGGFVASTYMRGLPFIQLPTTLLAMVDASIGGKVAVNLPQAKNLIGSFYQPSLVGIELNSLRTLPLTQLTYGLVEAVKHGAVADSAYYKFIYRNREAIKSKDVGILQRLVRRSINIKKAIVEADEHDYGPRMHLNFGHTFGHALETIGEYRRYHHAEAVGIGMLLAIRAAKIRGMLQEDYSDSLREMLIDFNLPTSVPREFSVEMLVRTLVHDKKRAPEKIKFVLPIALGKVEVVSIPTADLSAFLEKILKE